MHWVAMYEYTQREYEYFASYLCLTNIKIVLPLEEKVQLRFNLFLYYYYFT